MSKQKHIISLIPKSIEEERDEFISKVFTLSKEYGINQIFIDFSRPHNHAKDLWCFKATADLEVLVNFLEEIAIPSLSE